LFAAILLPPRRAIRRSIRLLGALGAGLAIVESSAAADIAICNSGLAQMQVDRRELAQRANEVATALDQLETCVRQNKELGKFDDSCRRQASDYQRLVARLHSALDGADDRVRMIGGACGQLFIDGSATTAPRIDPVPAQSERAVTPPAHTLTQSAPATRLAPTDPSCELARSYKRKIPFDGVVKICLRTLTEDECRRCLGTLDE
jgi:hypothetical protein